MFSVGMQTASSSATSKERCSNIRKPQMGRRSRMRHEKLRSRSWSDSPVATGCLPSNVPSIHGVHGRRAPLRKRLVRKLLCSANEFAYQSHRQLTSHAMNNTAPAFGFSPSDSIATRASLIERIKNWSDEDGWQ